MSFRCKIFWSYAFIFDSKMGKVFVIRYLTKKKKCPLYVLISEKYFKYASFTTREELPEMEIHSMDVWNDRVT